MISLFIVTFIHIHICTLTHMSPFVLVHLLHVFKTDDFQLDKLLGAPISSISRQKLPYDLHKGQSLIRFSLFTMACPLVLLLWRFCVRNHIVIFLLNEANDHLRQNKTQEVARGKEKKRWSFHLIERTWCEKMSISILLLGSSVMQYSYKTVLSQCDIFWVYINI